MPKRMILAALMATAIATPALAQRDGHGERRAGRGDVPQRNFERREAPAAQAPQQIQQQAPAAVPRDRSAERGSGGDGARGWRQQQGEARAAQVVPRVFEQRQGDNANRGWRGADASRNAMAQDRARRDRDGDGVPNFRDRDRDGDGVRNRRDFDRNNNGQVDRRFDRNRNGVVDRRFDYNRDGVRDRNWNNGNGTRWSRDWRNDRRYDWQSYRYSNRNLFRAPRYYSPYGYGSGYQRFGVGIYLDSVFFGSNYRISDPYRYRLPDADWPYEWVRYYGDVLLVDARNGYVVDVIYDFFW